MEKIKTATGKEFNSDYAVSIPVPALAFVRILNTPLATVKKIFSDPKETAKLYYDGIAFFGYTRVVDITPEADAVKVTLEKE